MYMSDIMLSAKNEKEFETDTKSMNIQTGYRNGLYHKKIGYARNEK